MACVGCDNTMVRFIRSVDTLESMKDFLVSHGIVRDTVNCPSCGSICNLKFNIGKEELAYGCKKQLDQQKCNFFRRAKKDTFIGAPHLSVDQILKFCALWCILPNPRQKTLIAEIKIKARIVVYWSNFCREVCLDWVYDNRRQIGGPGKVVEIDGSKFCRQKYKRGRLNEGQWVFGGVERGNARNFFVVTVENRDAETLVNIILQWILPGTTIVSDCWKDYNSLENEDFVQLRANHSVEFVDTAESGDIHIKNLRRLAGEHVTVNKKNIEKKWLSRKYSVPVFGLNKRHFEGHFAEHIFKTSFPRSRLICEFFKRAAVLYPPPH